jgi:hypothetical protein
MTEAEMWSGLTYVYTCHVNLVFGVECTAFFYGRTSIDFPSLSAY